MEKKYGEETTKRIYNGIVRASQGRPIMFLFMEKNKNDNEIYVFRAVKNVDVLTSAGLILNLKHFLKELEMNYVSYYVDQEERDKKDGNPLVG